MDYFRKRRYMPEERDYGLIIGYNYHGAHANTPWAPIVGDAIWLSPQKLTDPSTLVLLSDMNDWSPGYGQTFVPHGKNGAVMQPGDYVFLYQKADVGYDTGRRLLLWKSGPTLPVMPLLAQRGAGR